MSHSLPASDQGPRPSAGAGRAVQFPPILPAHAHVTTEGEIEERPAGYVGPNLDPTDLSLIPKQLGDGVYALVASQIPRDNGGVIVGGHAALVIDAGINGAMGRQIQAIVRELTDRPLRYLINTTYHGDHTFGNAAFPPEVQIISSRLNKAAMTDLDREKRIRSRNLHGNADVIADVTEWRKPDITFEHFLEVDLGGRTVQLWCFGQGNGPGDTIVYEPATRTAWTGNFLGHAGVAPMLLEGGPRPYVESLKRMRETLQVRAIIPGHGPMAHGSETIDWMIDYLSELDQYVRQGLAAGRSADELIEQRQMPTSNLLPPQALQHLGNLNRNMDRLNVLATIRDIERQRKQEAAGSRRESLSSAAAPAAA